MSRLIVKELEDIFKSVEPTLRETEERVRKQSIEASKEYNDYMYEVDPKTGKQRREVYNSLVQEKKMLLEKLRDLDGKKPEIENKIIERLQFINQVIIEHEKVKKEYEGLDVNDQERIRNEERKKVIAFKLQESYDAIEETLKKSEARLGDLIDELKQNPEDVNLRREIGKEQTKVSKLRKQLASMSRIQNYDGRYPNSLEEAKLLDGLDPKSDEYELFSSYIKYINKYGNVKKDSKEPINTDPIEVDPDPNKKDPTPPEPDPTKKDPEPEPTPIPEDIEIEQPIQIPQNIQNKPEKTWKTVAAVALGAGVAIGSYLAFGPAGTGVVMAVSGIGKLVIRHKEKKLKEQEQLVIQIGEHIAEINAESEALKQRIAEVMQLIETAETEEQKAEINKTIEEAKEKICCNNQAVIQFKTQAQEILNRIYPDLKAAEFNGPEKITGISDAKEKVKAKVNKFKAYLGSKEGLRDARWFMNSALITSAGINIAHSVAGMVNSTPAPIDTPTAVPGDASVVTEAGIYDGIGVGESVGGYNLSVGHDTASWALEGTNAEGLISEYVNGTDSIFKGFRIATSNGTVPLDLNGMNLGEFLQANPNIDPSSIVADVASKDGISQAWVSIEELVKGVGGRSL